MKEVDDRLLLEDTADVAVAIDAFMAGFKLQPGENLGAGREATDTTFDNINEFPHPLPEAASKVVIEGLIRLSKHTELYQSTNFIRTSSTIASGHLRILFPDQGY